MSRLTNHSRTAINLSSQVQYDKLMEVFEEEGWRWRRGQKPIQEKNHWKKYKQTFCITYHDKFSYSNIKYYTDERYKIITFKKFMCDWDEAFLLWHEYNNPIEKVLDIEI